MAHSGVPAWTSRSASHADLSGAPVGSAASLLRAARGRASSAGRLPMSARPSAGRLPVGLQTQRANSASSGLLRRSLSEAATSPDAIDGMLRRPLGPSQRDGRGFVRPPRAPSQASQSRSPSYDEGEGFTGDDTVLPVEDQYIALAPAGEPTSTRSESQKTSVGKAILQEQVLHLKAELNESEAEAKRYRHRMVHLEGDVQGKVQWMIAWERQMAMKAGIGEPPDNGLNGLGWSAWDTFVGRGEVESQKTQRLLTRTVNMDWHRAVHSELQEAVEAESAVLEVVESRIRTEDVENSRLSAALRRRDNHSRKLMKTAEAHRLECQLATQEAELARCVTSETNQLRELSQLEEELKAQRRILEDMPSQKMKRKLHQAGKQKDGLQAEYEEEVEKRLQQTLQGEWEHFTEMSELRNEESCLDDSLAESEEELRELEWFLEETRHIESLTSKAEHATSQDEARRFRESASKDELRWRQAALRLHHRQKT